MGALQRFWRIRCLPCLRRVLGLPLSIGGVVLLVGLIAFLAIRILWLVPQLIPAVIALIALVYLRVFSVLFKNLVEHVYGSRWGKAHVWMSTRFQQEPYHTRFVDLRIDVALAGADGDSTGGVASVHLVPMLADNYAYLVVDAKAPSPKPACIIDPCDAHGVVDALAAIRHIHYGGEELDLEAILTTHKHWDHQGGNLDLPRLMPGVRKVYGGAADSVLGCTHKVHHGDAIQVGGLTWRTLALPGHTRGCMAFLLRGAAGRDCLMTGDALFCAGRCGAAFETCEGEEHRNLLTILRECGERTMLFPGHEYTAEILDEAYQISLGRFEGGHSSAPTPGMLLAIAAAHHAALHRRAQPRGAERVPSVPLSLQEDTWLGASRWRQLQRHAMVLGEALEAKDALADEEEEGEARAGTAEAEESEAGAAAAPASSRGSQEEAQRAAGAATAGVEMAMAVEETPCTSTGRKAASENSSGEIMVQHREVDVAATSFWTAEVGVPAALLPTPVVLPSDRMPSACTVVAMYREDFERICESLEADRLSGAEAAAALRAARGRLDDKSALLEGAAYAAASAEGPPQEELEAAEPLARESLCHSLRVLGAPPEVSIGREAADLEEVEIQVDHLVRNVRLLCGEDFASKVQGALKGAREAEGDLNNSTTVAEAVRWITGPPPTSGSNDGEEEEDMPRCSPCSCLFRFCSCLVQCICCCSLARCCRSCCCWRRRHVPLEELLVPPRHDVRKCAMCSGVWQGVPVSTVCGMRSTSEPSSWPGWAGSRDKVRQEAYRRGLGGANDMCAVEQRTPLLPSGAGTDNDVATQ